MSCSCAFQQRHYRTDIVQVAQAIDWCKQHAGNTASFAATFKRERQHTRTQDQQNLRAACCLTNAPVQAS